MFTKKRLFTLLTVVTLLALLPTTALAATFTIGGVTVTYPDSATTCTPTGALTFANVGTNDVWWQFNRYDQTTGTFYEIARGEVKSDGSVDLPYPQVAGTTIFEIRIVVIDTSGKLVQDTRQWKITCSPPPGGQGCTPGYWRNHYASWPAPYIPGGSFNAAFLVGENFWAPGFFSNSYTLGQAIWQGGGGLNRLARHGSAALLNAASPDVNYPYTVAEVIAMVQAGYIDPLAQANELGCPIN